MGLGQEQGPVVPELAHLIQLKKEKTNTEGEGERMGEEISAAKKDITNSTLYTHSKPLLTLFPIYFVYKFR